LDVVTLAASSFFLLFSFGAHAQSWNVRVEEPTGLYRRTDEVVAQSSGLLMPPVSYRLRAAIVAKQTIPVSDNLFEFQIL